MIFFDASRRAELLPDSLTSPEFSTMRDEIRRHMALSAPERRQTDVPQLWKLRWGGDVMFALRKMSQDRCAFCERRAGDLQPWLFRPPAHAQPDLGPEGKLSYLWLALDWWNLYPICQQCIPDRPEYFPVKGDRAGYAPEMATAGPQHLDEQPLLIHPGEPARPERDFDQRLDGRLLGRTSRARATIRQYRLDRPELVRARQAALAEALRTAGSGIDWDAVEFPGPILLVLLRLLPVVAEQNDLPLAAPDLRRPDHMGELLRDWGRHLDLYAALTRAEGLRRPAAPRRDAAPAPRPPQEGPRLKSVTIRTFKSLEDIAFEMRETLPPRTDHPAEAPCLMILGENATGKSSILEAIALACLPEAAVRKLPLKPQDLTLNPEYMGQPRFELLDQTSVIDVRFHDGSHRALTISARSQSMDWQGDAAPPPIFAYGAHRLFGRTRRRGAERHHDTLFRNDRQLSNPENWLHQLSRRDPTGLDEVVAALRHIIQIDGAFESIGFDDALGDPRCIIRLRRQMGGKEVIVPQPLEIASSGFRAVLALVCDILDGLMTVAGDARAARRTRAIVLIDEIEAHLHPRWKLHVMTGLRRALPKVTFIATSHDPLCLRGMFNGEVLALNRYYNIAGDGLDLPERIEPVDEFGNIEAMTVDQLLTSDLFQLFSTDDHDTERQFARAADLLSTAEKAALDEEIMQAMPAMVRDLPIGRTEAGRLVQETVADFLAARRHSRSDHAGVARDRASRAVRDWLRELLP